MKKLFCYPKWGTCRKAVNWLEANNIQFEYVDITLSPPSKQVIRDLFEANDYPLKAYFNTSGVRYRDLNMKDRLMSISNEEAFDLLSSEGKLIKRPFFICEDKLLIGFKEDIWRENIK